MIDVDLSNVKGTNLPAGTKIELPDGRRWVSDEPADDGLEWSVNVPFPGGFDQWGDRTTIRMTDKDMAHNLLHVIVPVHEEARLEAGSESGPAPTRWLVNAVDAAAGIVDTREVFAEGGEEAIDCARADGLAAPVGGGWDARCITDPSRTPPSIVPIT